jgi:hypothetical protein
MVLEVTDDELMLLKFALQKELTEINNLHDSSIISHEEYNRLSRDWLSVNFKVNVLLYNDSQDG